MKELKFENLTQSIYDRDTNDITLIYEVNGKQIKARGTAPEESFTDEGYFDNEENVEKFLEDAEIEED